MKTVKKYFGYVIFMVPTVICWELLKNLTGYGNEQEILKGLILGILLFIPVLAYGLGVKYYKNYKEKEQT